MSVAAKAFAAQKKTDTVSRRLTRRIKNSRYVGRGEFYSGELALAPILANTRHDILATADSRGGVTLILSESGGWNVEVPASAGTVPAEAGTSTSRILRYRSHVSA